MRESCTTGISCHEFISFGQGTYSIFIMGASLVGQYPITLVHIVVFKIIKNSTNILNKYWGGMRGLRCGDRVVYKE